MDIGNAAIKENARSFIVVRFITNNNNEHWHSVQSYTVTNIRFEKDDKKKTKQWFLGEVLKRVFVFVRVNAIEMSLWETSASSI